MVLLKKCDTEVMKVHYKWIQRLFCDLIETDFLERLKKKKEKSTEG